MASRSATVAAARERPFVHRDLERFFERHHQLDALERAQPQLVDRGRRLDRPAGREAREDGRDSVASAFGGAATPAGSRLLVPPATRAARAASACACLRSAAAPVPGHTAAARIFW